MQTMSSIAVNTIKPGILVSLKSTVTGGVNYERNDLRAETAATGAEVRHWKTTCYTADPDEHARATKVRNRAIYCVRSLCADTALGLVCPLEREVELRAAIEDMRRIVDEYEATARYTHVRVTVYRGTVDATDAENVNAVAEEVARIVSYMAEALARRDVKAIRDAATDAASLAMIVSDDAAQKLVRAIEAARDAANQIAKQEREENRKGANGKASHA